MHVADLAVASCLAADRVDGMICGREVDRGIEVYSTGMVRNPISILCAFVLLTCAWAVSAADPAVDIAQAVRDLGAPSFAARKAAQVALATVGWEARKELEEAARSADPEVGDVARQLLAEMLPGVTRATPDKQRQIVVRYAKDRPLGEKQACIRELLEQSPVPCQLLLDLLEWEQSGILRATIVTETLARTSAVLGPMLEAGDTTDYEHFLQWAVRLEIREAIPRVADYAWSRGKLADLRAQVAAQLAKNENPYLRRLLAELRLLAGERDQAVAVATPLDDLVYRQDLLVRAGHWAELAALLAADEDEPTGPALVRLAAAQRLAGDDKLAAATLARIATLGKDKDAAAPGLGGAADDGEEDIIWLDHVAAPVLLGAWQEGMVIADGDGPAQLFQNMQWDAIRQQQGMAARRGGRAVKTDAWRFLLAYGLVGDALLAMQQQEQKDQAIGLLQELYHYAEADRMLKDMLAAAKPPQDAFLTLSRAGMLRALGDPEADRMAGDVLARCRNGEEGLADDKVFAGLLSMVEAAGFHDLLAASLPELMGRFADPSDRSLAGVVQCLAPPASRSQAWFWWGRMVKANPGEAMAERATRLRDFLTGRLDATATETVLRLGLQPDASAEARVHDLCSVSRACLVLDRQEEALSACRMAVRFAAEVENKNVVRGAQSLLSSTLATCGQWGEAATVYGQQWQEYRNPADLLAQGMALIRAGDQSGADVVAERLPCLLTVDQAAWALGKLSELDWPGPTRRLLELAICGSHLPLDDAIAAARHTGDYELELRLAQRQWFEGILAVANRSTGSALQTNATLAFAECRAGLAGAGPAATLALAKRVSDAFPFDVDGVADTVEAMDRSGAKAEADALCGYALAREQRVLDKLPDAVHHLNGYAWLCARTGRKLKEGEAYARRAVARAPEQDAILDTLAVLQYRLGDLDGAIAAGRTCLRMKPGDHHYQQQLARWQAETRVQP